MSKDRFTELDVFRGLAALIVVLFHYFSRFDAYYGHVNIPSDWAKPGLYGVHFFFLISGFVIFWSLENCPNIKTFVVSRFSRIYPAYWVALIITFTIMSVFGLPGREVSFASFLGNFLMFHEYLNIPHVDFAYWTLTIELTFYFWMLVLFATRQLKHAHHFLFAMMVLSALHQFDIIPVPYRVSRLLLFQYGYLFASGIIFYRIYTGKQTPLDWFILLCGIAMSFLFYSVPISLMLGGFHGLFLLAVRGYLRWMRNPVLLWLGGVSFTLYLLHQNIGYAIIRGVYALGGNGWLAIAVALLSVLLMAELLSRIVERPAARWLRSFTQANKPQKTAPLQTST